MTQRVSDADAGPFDLGDGRVGALCLHGLTGRPYEIRPVAEALVNAGMRAVGPLLPGHEETPERLARIEGDEWVRAVHDAYRALRREHETVVLAGVSLGGFGMFPVVPVKSVGIWPLGIWGSPSSGE